MDIDYRSVQHHITVLTKNSLIIGSGQRYGAVFTIHPWLEHNISMFDEICSKVGFSQWIPKENPTLISV